MSKAKDLAKELYPDWRMTGVSNVDGQEESMVRIQRVAYIKGYHQAEKDLELTWEDIREICRMWIESKTPFGVTGEALSIEVLKRFKNYRMEK